MPYCASIGQRVVSDISRNVPECVAAALSVQDSLSIRTFVRNEERGPPKIPGISRKFPAAHAYRFSSDCQDLTPLLRIFLRLLCYARSPTRGRQMSLYLQPKCPRYPDQEMQSRTSLVSSSSGRPSGPTEVSKLEGYLDAARVAGTLTSLVYRGKLNCRVISAKLGIRHSTLHYASNFKRVIDKYNALLRGQGYLDSKYDTLVPSVDAWLEKLHLANRLPVSRVAGRLLINRRAVQREFHFPLITFTRHRNLRAVVEKWDSAIDPLLYPPAFKHAGKLSELRRVLSRQPPPLSRGHLNLTAIASELQISWDALCETPQLASELAHAEERIAKNKAKSIVIDTPEGRKEIALDFEPFVVQHGRRYSFCEFSTFVEPHLLHRIAAAFAQDASRRAVAKTGYLALIKFLHFAVAKRRALRNGLKNGIVTDSQLAEAAFAWRQDQAGNSSIKPTTRSQSIKALHRALKSLHTAQVLPEPPALRPLRQSRSFTRERPSFGELPYHRRLHEVLAEDGMKQRSRLTFLQSIESERRLTPDLPGNSVEAFLFINQRRLKAVRRAMEEVLRQSRVDFEFGARLLRESDMAGADIEQAIERMPKIPRDRAACLQRLFPQEPGLRSLSRFLAFLVHRFGALIPRGPRADALGQFYGRRYRCFGGSHQIQRYLSCTDNALTAALTLYLIDSGANPTTGRELFSDPFESSNLPYYRAITGSKSRAGGKPITKDLPIVDSRHEVSAVQALEWIQEMTFPLRLHASSEEQRLLFLRRSNCGAVELLPEFQFTACFRRILQDAKGFEHLHLLPSMIRPSVLLDHRLRPDGSLASAQILADHSHPSTTRKYTERGPTRELGARKIRRFQNAFEASLAESIPEAAAKLGTSVDDLQYALADARRHGLKAFSIRPQSAASSSTDLGLKCGNSRITFLATPSALADLLQWRVNLQKCVERDSQDIESGLRTNRALLLCDVILERFQRGPLQKRIDHALRLVREREASGDFGPAPRFGSAL